MRANPMPLSYAELNDLLWQEGTYPVWCDEKNGDKFEYNREAVVRYDGVVYISLYDSNIDEPTKSSKWVKLWDYLSPKDLLTNGKLGFKSVGEVEQMGSKFESVSLYGPSGTIVMDATSLGANETVNFQGVGSFIEETDVVVTTIQSLSSSIPSAYRVDATVMNGYIDFYVTNTSSSFLKEAVRINYKIIK